MRKYSKSDIGCYADGTYGDAHVSQVAISTATQAGWSVVIPENVIPSDEDIDDYARDAVAWLNDHAVTPEVYFEFVDGDLLLCSADDSDDETSAEFRPSDETMHMHRALTGGM
jgi:hypothetical protein